MDPETLRRMTRSLHHRGPDTHGFFTAPGIALGVQRLSIVDTRTGDQPIANEDGSIVVICNGEIYNFVELRKGLEGRGHRFRSSSDTEVMVHLYEETGPDFVKLLRGMFAFALWDSPRRILMLARDRLGIKPLYYTEGPAGVAFGSEIKPMLISGFVSPGLDPGAVRDLAAFGFVPGPGTFFKGVQRLQPGHYRVYRGGAARERQYWRVSFSAEDHSRPSMRADEWAEALLAKLTECIRLHLRSDVPIGAWLSSGIDSSSIVALVGRLTNRPVETFSLAFDGADFDEIRDRRTLAQFPEHRALTHEVVCRRSDLERFPRAVWHCENISSTGNEVVHLTLSEATARKYKVVLTGEGSDEIFGGYGWFRVEKLLGHLAILPAFLRRLTLLGPILPVLWPGASRIHTAPRQMNRGRYQCMIGPRRPEFTAELLSLGLREEMRKAGSNGGPDVPGDFQGWGRFSQLQYHEMTLRLPDFILHSLDHLTMAHSLEARVPFLDHELVEFCSRIPAGLKMKYLREKHILREAMSSVLPAELTRRKKLGLRAPIGQWLRGQLPEFAADMLSEADLRRKGYFQPSRVLGVLERHRAGERNYADQLMTVLAIQLWDELFIRRGAERAP
jgi:asparagine synthase (glutamine-hydrolysing)